MQALSELQNRHQEKSPPTALGSKDGSTQAEQKAHSQQSVNKDAPEAKCKGQEDTRVIVM